MAIASRQYEGLGSRIYTAEGPYGTAGQTPLPNQQIGAVVAGDMGAEFVFCLYAPTVSATYNQGDFFFFDGYFYASATLSGSAANATTLGTNLGTLFFGGRIGDPAADTTGNIWSYAFVAGNVYGIWLQRAGTCCGNWSVLTHQYSLPSTTATAGSLATPTGSTHYASFATAASTGGSVGWYQYAPTLTATTTSGSAYLTSVTPSLGTDLYGIGKGDTLSGTGIPNGTYVVDINGASGNITMSQNATSGNSAETTTANKNIFWGTIQTASTSAANFITVPAGYQLPSGIFPNCKVSGTGLSSTSITSISGNVNQGWQVNFNATATQELTLEAMTVTGYYESFVNWPNVQATT